MKLYISMNGIPAGVLQVQRGRFSFCYLPSYLDAHGIALSVRMPISLQTYSDDVAFPFFENLLPEGEIRHLAAEAADLDYQAIHKLLERFGGDVAGALTIGSKDNTKVPLKRLSEQSLAELLYSLPAHLSLTADVAGQRMSLAGAMPKLPVLVNNGVYYLPGSQASTHILKPEPERFPGLATNEYLCMQLAAQVGLNAAQCQLQTTVNGMPYLVVRRYDRDGRGNRIHQEDFCQALGYVSSYKYQADGGPAAGQLFAALKQHSQMPAKDTPELFLRMLFNLVVGNADAHAKNSSLIHMPSGSRLAPLYDVVSTQYYPQLDNKLAMQFGDADCIEELTGQSFKRAAEDADINLNAIRPRIKQLLNKVALNLPTLAQQVAKEHPASSEVVQKLQKAVLRRNKCVANNLGFSLK